MDTDHERLRSAIEFLRANAPHQPRLERVAAHVERSLAACARAVAGSDRPPGQELERTDED